MSYVRVLRGRVDFYTSRRKPSKRSQKKGEQQKTHRQVNVRKKKWKEKKRGQCTGSMKKQRGTNDNK